MISNWISIILVAGGIAVMSIASLFYEHGEVIQTIIMK